MQLLFIGDIVGSSGRKATQLMLTKLKRKHDFDLVIANGENLTNGKGVNLKTLAEIQSYGVDFLTSGNHVFSFKDIYPSMNQKNPPLIRPLNYPEGVPGRGYRILKIGKKTKLAVINAMGLVFMRANIASPFTTVKTLVTELRKKGIKNILLDFHAEATSEKQAMLHYLNGTISALVGTHTHVQTNDPYITNQGTFFIADVGAVCARNSIIGAKVKPVLQKFLTQMSLHFETEKQGPFIFNAVRLKLNDKGKVCEYELINELIDFKVKNSYD